MNAARAFCGGGHRRRGSSVLPTSISLQEGTRRHRSPDGDTRHHPAQTLPCFSLSWDHYRRQRCPPDPPRPPQTTGLHQWDRAETLLLKTDFDKLQVLTESPSLKKILVLQNPELWLFGTFLNP